jgi:hypothetical protein
MSERSEINIVIEEEQVSFSTDMSMIELNFWLDHIKNLIITGEAIPKES